MKKAVKEVCLLDVEDIEKAICARLGKTVTLAEPAPEVDEIFNFDVSVFKSFDVWTDTSD